MYTYLVGTAFLSVAVFRAGCHALTTRSGG
jgi:hypothetical protein